MAAKTGTYTLIASTAGTGSSGTVSFTSINSAYTDLVLVINANGSYNGFGVYMTLNGDTTSKYSVTTVKGNSGGATSSRNTSQTNMLIGGWSIGAGSTYNSPIIMHINDYANTSTYKTVLTRANIFDNTPNSEVSATVGLYQSTSAISRIDLITGAGNWNTTASFKLYGIEAGNL